MEAETKAVHTVDFGERYETLSLLGSGRTSDVYLARHRGGNKNVAIKKLQQRYVTSEDVAHKFEREALHAARVLHPNPRVLVRCGLWG